MQTRRSFLKSSVAVPGLMASASILSMHPTPARAQVVEGISLLISAYQAFGKKGGDGGLSAILKNTLEKLDQIHSGLNLLSEKLDTVIAIIAGSTDEIISQIQRSEMRSFTSSILTQVKRYEILQPLMATRGIEGIRTYNNGDELRRIRDQTYDSLIEMFSVERASMVYPIDIITSILGLGLFALVDSIIDNDQSVRDRAILTISDLIMQAATLDGQNGTSIYIARFEERLKSSAAQMVKVRRWPNWAAVEITKLLQPKIHHTASTPLIYSYSVPQAIWLAYKSDYTVRKCETRTRTVGGVTSGSDRDEDYNYCFDEPHRQALIKGYSLSRSLNKPPYASHYVGTKSTNGEEINLREYSQIKYADLLESSELSLSKYNKVIHHSISSSQQVGSEIETSADLFQSALESRVAELGDSVSGPSGLSRVPFSSQAVDDFIEIYSNSSDWVNHAALLQAVVDALKMLNVTHSALVRET